MKATRKWIILWACIALYACANGGEKSSQESQPQTTVKPPKEVSLSKQAKSVQADAKNRVPLNADTIDSEQAIESHVNAKPVNKQYIRSKSDKESIKIVKDKEESLTQAQSTKSVTESNPKTPSQVIKNTAKAVTEGVGKSVKSQVSETQVVVENTKKKTIEKAKEETAESETLKPEKPAKPARLAQTHPMHKYFDYLLKNNVSADGVVNYKGILADVDRLDKYIADLEKFPPKGDWTNDEQLAYWINAYNAYTIKLIVENYPLNSITDLHGGKPWDHKWINIDGKSLSLNAIENEIIRPTFKEPRIHFAVNCAAQSCPPLANTAYTKDNLESLLEGRTRAFINDVKYNVLTTKPAQVSKIFEWYAVDFGDVPTFINNYMELKQPPIEKVVYSEYDWSLNDK